MVVKIPLTRGKHAMVDDIDKDLAQKKWYCTAAGYAVRDEHRKKSRKTLYMHRVILERKIGRPLTSEEICDHIDADTVNNRRINLRSVTVSQSVHNTAGNKEATSIFKGVHFSKKKDKWVAKIMKDRKNKVIGHFDTESLAATAYDYWAIKLHGKYARLNFPQFKKTTILWGDSFFNSPKKVGPNSGNTSGYRGVYKIQGRWAARITHNGDRIFLGLFGDPKDAAKAYDKKAIELKGSRARINF